MELERNQLKDNLETNLIRRRDDLVAAADDADSSHLATTLAAREQELDLVRGACVFAMVMLPSSFVFNPAWFVRSFCLVRSPTRWNVSPSVAGRFVLLVIIIFYPLPFAWVV